MNESTQLILTDATQLLFAVGIILNASAACAGVVISLLNGRKSARIESTQVDIKNDMKELAINTNSKMDLLLDTTAKVSKAEGKAEGVAQGLIEGAEKA
jgi:hypothetical protein